VTRLRRKPSGLLPREIPGETSAACSLEARVPRECRTRLAPRACSRRVSRFSAVIYRQRATRHRKAVWRGLRRVTVEQAARAPLVPR